MVRVPLRYTRHGLVVTAILVNQLIKPGPVEFLVDTGATTSSISPQDQRPLDIDPVAMSLPRYHKVVRTLGGKANAFLLENSMICLPSDPGKRVDRELKELLVMEGSGGRMGKGRREKEHLRMLDISPSILGRDFMERHDMKLTVDFKTKEALLEIP